MQKRPTDRLSRSDDEPAAAVLMVLDLPSTTLRLRVSAEGCVLADGMV